MNKTGIIFDVDGTLVDSNDAHVEAWWRAFQSLGYDIERERISAEIGKGGDQLVPAILGDKAEAHLGKQLRHRHTEEFYRLIEQQPLRLLPGAMGLLRESRGRGLRVALATSSKREELEAVQRSCGTDLIHEADTLTTADDAESSKPAPDLVKAAVGKLELDPRLCVMVGDTPYDAQASHKAGVECIGLLCGRQHSREILQEAGMMAIYRDPADLMTHFDEAVGG